MAKTLQKCAKMTKNTSNILDKHRILLQKWNKSCETLQKCDKKHETSVTFTKHINRVTVMFGAELQNVTKCC